MDNNKKYRQYDYNKNLNSTDNANKSSSSTQANSFNEMNTNISDYSFDDIFNILEIKMDSYENYEEFKEQTNIKIDNYIAIFENLKNYKLVDFFKKIKNSLFGSIEDKKNTTEAQKILASNLNEKNINMSRDTITKVLTVDSRFRADYNGSLSTDFNISLPYSINNVTELQIHDIEFPATFYTFQENFENNYMWLKYTYSDNGQVTTGYIYFYIPPANYTQIKIIEDMQAVIDTSNVPLVIKHDLNIDVSSGIEYGTGTVTFEPTEDSGTSGITITNLELNFKSSMISSSDSSYNVSHFIGSEDEKISKYYNVDSAVNYKQRMGWILGFRKSLYNGSTSYTSEGQLDIIGPRYVYLLVNDFNTSSNVNFLSNSETNLLANNILGRISLKNYTFSVQLQKDFTIYGEPRYFFGRVNIDKLEIKVIDEFGRIINLNGMDFSFTIRMTVNYDV